MEQYSLLPLWRSMQRRMAEVATYFNPWTKNPYVIQSMQSEMAFLRAVIGRRRLEIGNEMPPFSVFLFEVQVGLSAQNHPAFAELPGKATLFLTGSEGPEPVDTTGFPQWWVNCPITGPPPSTPPFNLSAWIIAQGQEAMGQALQAEQADVGQFVEELKVVLQRLRGLQTSSLERAKAFVHLNDESERALKQMHDARQRAATLAQRRHEDANDLPHGPVPFQADIPEW